MQFFIAFVFIFFVLLHIINYKRKYMELNKDLIRQVLEGEGTYKEKYFAIYGETVSKDKARHHINKLYRNLVLQDDITQSLDKIHTSVENINNTLNNSKLTINADGSQCSEKLVDCSEEELKNPEFLLKLHGYDPKKFELVTADSSMWQNGACNGKRTLYSSRIKVRPVSLQKNLIEIIDNAIAKYKTIDMEHLLIKFAPNPQEYGDDYDTMVEFCFPDLHIGLSENEEGEESIVKDQTEMWQHVYKMSQIIKKTRAKNVCLCFLGDILHYDNANKTTTKGTPQCSNVSFQKMFDTAVETVRGIIATAIYNMPCDSKLKVLYVPGNHDTILGYTIMSVMKALFERPVCMEEGMRVDDIPVGVSFDITQKPRKFIVFGSNLIGFAHGDMNAKRLNQWLYTEAREYISDAKQIEVHCGHLHSEQTEEANGMIVRHLPTICGTSPWEYEKGYSSIRRLAAFIWNNEEGLNEIVYF